VDRTEQTDIIRYDKNGKISVTDTIVREHPLTILVNGTEIATLLCTPEKLEELAVGFLESEGLISNPECVKDIILSSRNRFCAVEYSGDFEVSLESFGKRVIRSGCSGEASLYLKNDMKGCSPVPPGFKITSDSVLALMKEFLKKGELFRQTGGVHSAGLAKDGQITLSSEDIGRHNAVDKIFGRCFRKGIDTSEAVMLTTGRISSEILIKCVRRSVPVIASRSAPTSLAAGLADQMNVTLAGFVRGERMNIYTHPERIG